MHLEGRALPREGLSLLRRLAHPDRSWLKMELLRELIVLLRLLLLLDVDAPHLRRVLPEDLLLDLHRQVDAVLLLQVVGMFEIQEVFDDPFRVPERVVRAEVDQVRSDALHEYRIYRFVVTA